MTLPKAPAWLTTAGSMAAGAAFGYLAQHVPNGNSVADWKPVAIGAVGAALIALAHLYQPAPVKPPEPMFPPDSPHPPGAP